MKLTSAAMLLTTTLAFAATATAQTSFLPDGVKPTGPLVMKAVELREDGKDQISDVMLLIERGDDQPRLRKFTLLRKEYEDRTKWATYFFAPAEVKDMAFLVWDMRKAPDRRWLYIPAVQQIRRLSTGDERKSFFGSDFVYEDLTNRDPHLDDHKLIGKQKFKKWDCYVVESTPKNPRNVEFAKYKTWVWREDPLVLKQTWYDSKGKVVRDGWIANLKKVQGIWTWHQGVMKNEKTGSTSKMQISNVRYNTGVEDQHFTERQLSKGAPSGL